MEGTAMTNGCKRENIVAEYRRLKVKSDLLKTEVQIPVTIIKCEGCSTVFRVLTATEQKIPA